MGIVKLSDQMHENLRLASAALSRSVNAQAEHWMRIGMLAELHPQLSHAQICQRLIQAELQGGLDLADMAARLAPAALPAAPPARPTRRVQ
ncbi:MAG: ParD-like family protein [Rubrivivax sp.]|nr:ParD-like family protein [Rubrivivax sp.]